MHRQLEQLQEGSCHDPFDVLGRQLNAEGEPLVRAFLPHAENVLLEGFGDMLRIEGSDLFEFHLDAHASLPLHYRLFWQQKGSATRHATISLYSFAPQVGDLDLHLFAEGRHLHAYRDH